MRPFHSVAEARSAARRVLPRAVFDYVDGGAEDEITMSENERAFREIAFRPKMAVGVGQPSLGVRVLGSELALPVILAPCGLIRAMHPEGAAGALRAAHVAGTISVTSTVAGVTPSALAEFPGPRWFQLYAADRDTASSLIDEARESGFEGLMLTIDTPALGKRERDIRNGVAPPLRIDARSALKIGSQILARPRWSLAMARSGLKVRRQSEGDKATSANAVAMSASPFSWDDVRWAREKWQGPLIVKGVLSGDDALLALRSGADAVVVSNHGGRQLEGAPATMRVLPEVVDALSGQAEVLVDSGVRRGGDVLKALALGARAVLVGRPYLYGLATGGQAGVEQILTIFRDEMTRTMVLLGCHSVSELDRSWLQL